MKRESTVTSIQWNLHWCVHNSYCSVRRRFIKSNGEASAGATVPRRVEDSFSFQFIVVLLFLFSCAASCLVLIQFLGCLSANVFGGLLGR